MTTIPPRACAPDFLPRLLHLRDNQTRPFHKLFLSIPRQYKRFPDARIDNNLLDTLDTMDWIDVIFLEEDYGPASKFLGPMLYRSSEIMSATALVILDDDRVYASTLVERYEDFFKRHPNISVATGNQELYFHRLLYPSLPPDFLDVRPCRTRRVSGFMSFGFAGISEKTKTILSRYTLQVLKNVPDSFFHDEGILWIFLNAMDIAVYNINHPFVSSIEKEAPEALCENTPVSRAEIEKKILHWTNHSLFFDKIVSFPPSTRLHRRLWRWG